MATFLYSRLKKAISKLSISSGSFSESNAKYPLYFEGSLLSGVNLVIYVQRGRRVVDFVVSVNGSETHVKKEADALKLVNKLRHM